MNKPKFGRQRQAVEDPPAHVADAPTAVVAEIPPAMRRSLMDDPAYADRQREVDRLERELQAARDELAAADRIEAGNARRGILPGHELVNGGAPGDAVPDRQPIREKLARFTNAVALARRLRDAEAVRARMRLTSIVKPAIYAKLRPMLAAAEELHRIVIDYRKCIAALEYDIDAMAIPPGCWMENGELDRLIQNLRQSGADL